MFNQVCFDFERGMGIGIGSGFRNCRYRDLKESVCSSSGGVAIFFEFARIFFHVRLGFGLCGCEFE